jgi:DNA-binding beta-propeller fold protein YncE
LRIAAQAAVGGYPIATALAGGKLWVAQDKTDRLRVVDAATRAVTDTPVLGHDLSGIAASGDRVWIGDYGRSDADEKGTVVDVDASTGRPLGQPIATIDPVALAADATEVWVTSQGGLIQRVDLATRRAGKPIRIRDLADVALLDGEAWFTLWEAGKLLRYDARTGRQLGRPLVVASRPVSIAASDGALWVATEQGELVRVPSGGGQQRSVTVGGEGLRDVAIDARGVWVADALGEVVLVDPARMAIRARVQIGGSAQGLALDKGGAWVLRSRSSAGSAVVRVVLDSV